MRAGRQTACACLLAPPALRCTADVWWTPGVALKIMLMFNCVDIEGTMWLVADMRQQCYTPEWFGYAV